MKRTKLSDRTLPNYTVGEERLNMISHIVGAGLGLTALILCTAKAAWTGNAFGILGSVIYGLSMIALYTVSSVYHGMRPGTAKKVMQVIDHCTIYLLISGSYSAVVLSAFLVPYPALG